MAAKYDDAVIGEYLADLLVDNKVLVEVRAVKSLRESDETQLINWLKAPDLEVGILVKFGERLEFRRKVYSNSKKNAQRIA